ncbi:MAG: hypothetical protein AAB660_00640 [Patescibacteria group bacterium]
MKKGLIVVSLAVAVFSASCQDDGPTAPKKAVVVALRLDSTWIDSIRLTEVVSLHYIAVPTYDSSGESIHPDFIRFDRPWAGYKYWMVVTPYRFFLAELENPSLKVSNDGENWIPAPGVPDPLVPGYMAGYNSDPELVFDHVRGCMSVVFRFVFRENNIRELNSCDGVNWGESRLLFWEPNHDAVSQTITDGKGNARDMFYVSAGIRGCGATSTEIKMRSALDGRASLGEMTFGPASSINMKQAGLVIWHLKVRYIPSKNEWWAMYVAYSPRLDGSCSRSDLYFAKSTNRTQWQTYPLPIVSRFDRRFDFLSVYRASFDYDSSTDELLVITSVIDSTDHLWQYRGVFNYPRLQQVLDLTVGSSVEESRARFSVLGNRHGSRERILMEDR